MRQEVFLSGRTLTLFSGRKTTVGPDGAFALTCDPLPCRLILLDTVIRPDGWAGSRLLFGWTRFDEKAALSFRFGKPNANDPADTARVTVTVTRTRVCVSSALGSECFAVSLGCSGRMELRMPGDMLEILGRTVHVPSGAFDGYLELSSAGGWVCMSEFSADSPAEPCTQAEHDAAILRWRSAMLDRADRALDRLADYLQTHPDALPAPAASLIVPERLLDCGRSMTVRVVSRRSANAAFVVTHNCFGADAVPEPYPLDLKQEDGAFCQDIRLNFPIPGNTRLEFWADGEKIVRMVGVLAPGALAVIPWVGMNTPPLDAELHRYEIPGDCWMYDPTITDDPEKTVREFSRFLRNARLYGDRTVLFINAGTLLPGSETDSLFELDRASQERGLHQLDRQMRLLGFGGMELAASYTPDAVSIGILEKLGVKGLTSLCVWQNWQDSGWKINHCGVSNQPYYPADDDFRRAGPPRGIMCFTMGTTTCSRNYSIMVYDGCPSNVVPGERYYDHRVLHHNLHRFTHVFDSWLADAANSPGLLTVTVALEAFRGFMDWTAVNDMAVRYMVERARTARIVFTSAADVSDYHRRRSLPLQEAYFFQPDFTYGYHNGTLPGRVADRIEAVTPEYLAVVRRGSALPMYFYDYTHPWENDVFEDTERNEFGLVDPDTHRPSECVPRQVNTEGVCIRTQLQEGALLVYASCKTPMERMVTAVFDIPFAAGFDACADKPDVRLRPIRDVWTGNMHLFIDLGALETGQTRIRITLRGTARTPVPAEDVQDLLGAMWFADEAYLRSLDKQVALCVELEAPEEARLHLISGVILRPEDGKLRFTVNRAWDDEAPRLTGFGRGAFRTALFHAQIRPIGPSACSRWSGQ